MSKKKFILKQKDGSSIIISIMAILISVLSLYMQFFYDTTTLQVGSISLVDESDSTYENRRIKIQLLMLNTGTNSVAFTKSYSFISMNGILPGGVYFYNNIIPNNAAIYTCCYSDINTILAAKKAQFIDLSLSINSSKLLEYFRCNKIEDKSCLDLGIHIAFVDSEGKKITKELIVGFVQFKNNYTIIKPNKNQPKKLIIY